MKTILFFGLLLSLFGVNADAQIVSDPLLDYFQKIQSYARPDDVVHLFKQDFTGDGNKSIFITDSQGRLGPHGTYGWIVYYPVASGGYQVFPNGIVASLAGPDYIGYIDQIKRYGIVTGGKYGVSARYLMNGTIESQPIDDEREHANAEHYPKYFPAKFPDYGITKYTLDQLAQIYAHPDPNNVIKSAGK